MFKHFEFHTTVDGFNISVTGTGTVAQVTNVINEVLNLQTDYSQVALRLAAEHPDSKIAAIKELREISRAEGIGFGLLEAKNLMDEAYNSISPESEWYVEEDSAD